MIRKESMKIVSTKEIAKETVEMVLKNSYISENAIPGQFLHILLDGHTLRRPISIADVDKENEMVTILFKKLGFGTEKLSESKVGDVLNVLGPSGNGFEISLEGIHTVLLIGGGIGVPPMYYLGKSLAKQNMNVISVLGFQSKEHVFYEERFQQFSKTYVVTNDGSYGDKGFVTNVIPKVGEFDRFYSCGPLPMLKAITNELFEKEGFISLEERMGCGVGACFACVVPTNTEKGYKKICSDGPVFDAREVIL
ncbi:dihydroorotate dehydrogenase electron transfer subunit [Oceanobacillus sp. Castelsardo]|uniref:dihydroorotate dehydrogenase electron transfer subunit n=1 Tax=Oceanobacillus sp. Castelsardo TaxID=1851204 RepID=UPI00083958F3|nr:dihydroorotate dehydrogenase electron transfer subunit [Oceanobacillus sp. Castelsardo]